MKWEYRIVTGRDMLTEQALNSLGDQGWELVGVSSHEQSVPQQTIILCIFKREKK